MDKYRYLCSNYQNNDYVKFSSIGAAESLRINECKMVANIRRLKSICLIWLIMYYASGCCIYKQTSIVLEMFRDFLSH